MEIRRLRRGFRWAYTVFLVAAFAIIYQRYSLPPLPPRFHWKFLGVAGLGQIAFWWLYAAIWRYLVHTLAGHRLSLRDAWIQCGLMAVGKYLPGKIWGLLGRGAALVDLGASPAESLWIAYTEQLAFVHAGVLVALSAFVWANPMGPMPLLAGAAALLSVPMAAYWGGTIYHLIGRYVTTVTHPLPAEQGPAEGRKMGTTTRPPLRWDWGPTEYLVLLGPFIGLWSLAGVVFAALYFTLYPFDAGAFPALITANAISLILGFLAFFAPAGIGVREAAILAIAGGAIPLESAAVLAGVYRAWTLATDAFSGAVVLVLQFSHRRKEADG